MDSLTENVICPNYECNKKMRPPFKLCIGLHVICHHCGYHYEITTGAIAIQTDCKGTEVEFTFQNAIFMNILDYCQYDCGFRGKILELDLHEETCYKRPKHIKCIIDHCQWDGSNDDLLEHVDSSHPNQLIVVPESATQSITVALDNPIYLLSKFSKDFYINNLYWLRLYQIGLYQYIMIQNQGHVGTPVEFDQRFYKFSICNVNNEDHSIKSKVTEYSNDATKHIQNIAFIKESGTDITALNGETYSLKIEGANQEGALMDSMRTELECDICAHIMISPIRQCKTGHSFCAECTTKLEKCPNCQNIIGETRNYALERLAEKLIVDCKFRSIGCLITGLADKMAIHSKFCVFRLTKCVVQSCEWNGPSHSLLKHWISEHNYTVNTNGSSRISTVPDNKCAWNIPLYCISNSVVVLTLTYDDDFVFAVNHLTDNDMSEFDFDIKFSNPVTGYSVSFTLPCRAAIADNISRKDYTATASNICRISKKLFFEQICEANKYQYALDIYKRESANPKC